VLAASLQASAPLPSGREVRARRPASFAERHVGDLASVALWAAILVTMAIRNVPPIVPPPPIELPDDVEIVMEPAPLAPPTEEITSGPELTEVAATRVPSPGSEVAAEPDFPEPAPEGGTIESWEPTAQQASALASIKMAIAGEASAVAARKQELGKGIKDLELDMSRREFLLASDGGMSGVIRTLDVSGHDEEEVLRVLRGRYGISVETKHVTPQAGRNFLNAAKTQEGTFTTAKEEGIYDVFILSPKARSMMATLEVTAMQKDGYDPTTTRVREIEFGMVRNAETGQLELAVVKLKAEKIR